MSTIYSNAATMANNAMALLTPGRTTQSPVSNLLGAEPVSLASPMTASSAATTSSSSSTSSSDSSSDITSADFMTLLVSELQNQDPTQPTDPNEYVQQLVGVNSLQQLISINQDLSGLNSSSGSTTPAATATSAV